MAKGQHFTRYQQGIVNRYYENQDTIVLTKLSELSSEIYLCTTPKKAESLWKSVAIALAKTSATPALKDRIVNERNVQLLAQLVADLSRSGAQVLAKGPRPPQAAAAAKTHATTPLKTPTNDRPRI